MRIRAVEVRNWACIESLSLTDLADGIVVLHGPNRTGKSSLAQALRSAVFDHFHDSQESTLLAAVPWKTKAAPHVTVEFEHGGARYRISKTFAKTKEGQAALERQSGSEWTVMVKGKDASKQVRELIGADSSAAGVFQMLWLGQRDFDLPRARALDPTLEASLEAVLGTLITGRDLEFKAALDKACERWFTIKIMKDKAGSPVTKLAAELQAALARQHEVDQQWTAAESALRAYDEALARQPALLRSRDDAGQEMARVQKECETIRQRQSQHDLAVNSARQCKGLLEKAERSLRDHDNAERELGEAGKALTDLQFQLPSDVERRIEVERLVVETRQEAAIAERRLTAHQQSRGELDDRQQSVNHQLARHSMEEKIRQADELDGKRRELEQALAGPAALTIERINEIRQARDRTAALRARLEAAEIHVTIRARQPLNVQIASDGDAAQHAELAASQEGRWLIRQHAKLELGDLATIRIGRGEEDRDLETLVRDLTKLEDSFRQALLAAQVDPNDADAIEQLSARRLQFDEDKQHLKKVRERFVKAAPAGLPALRAELQQKQDEQDAILARRPELAGWSPDQRQVDRLRDQFADQEGKLLDMAQQAKVAAERARETLEKAKEGEQQIRVRILQHEGNVQHLQKQLSGADRAALMRERDQAGVSLVEATRKVADSTLSEAEQAMEAQYESSKTAHLSRAERLRTNENLLLELRTKLAGTEGLHQRRIQAEQTVHDLTREHQRETLYATAHKHLKELFEKVRQEQVRRTVQPISNRVMTWAKQLGLADMADLSFGDQLLPVGFVPGPIGDGSAVELDRESFGTLEQLSLLIRLAVGGLLAQTEPAAAILDDPLAHADPGKHRKMLDILDRAARGEAHGPHPTGPLQIIILTCHADRFDYLQGAQQLDLASLIRRGS